MEELNCKVVFTIPVGKGLPIYESVVVTWIVMAILVLLSIILVRNLKVENPGKKQLALEAGYLFFRNFFHNLLGERGARYIPYMTMIVLFIGLSNIMGVFGFVPPTKDIGVTIGLAIMSIILIEYSGIHQKGTKGWLKALPSLFPLCFPSIYWSLESDRCLCVCGCSGMYWGSYVVMKLIEIICPILLPIPFNLYFDFFDGFIQAYVFVFLTSLFIGEAIE